MTFIHVEAPSTPEQAVTFPVEELDMRLGAGIATIEAELSLLPNNPDQKNDSLYSFGTPEQKMRADNDDMNPVLMAAVDATLGNVMTTGMGLSQDAASAVSNMSNAAEGASTFGKGVSNNRKPNFRKKKSDSKPAANNVMKPSAKSRGGKIVQKSAKDLMQERRMEVKRAEFKKHAGKRMAMEKKAAEMYKMREILQKYKQQGIRKVEIDMDGNKISPLATGAKMVFAPKNPMAAPAPTPFKIG